MRDEPPPVLLAHSHGQANVGIADLHDGVAERHSFVRSNSQLRDIKQTRAPGP